MLSPRRDKADRKSAERLDIMTLSIDSMLYESNDGSESDDSDDEGMEWSSDWIDPSWVPDPVLEKDRQRWRKHEELRRLAQEEKKREEEIRVKELAIQREVAAKREPEESEWQDKLNQWEGKVKFAQEEIDSLKEDKGNLSRSSSHHLSSKYNTFKVGSIGSLKAKVKDTLSPRLHHGKERKKSPHVLSPHRRKANRSDITITRIGEGSSHRKEDGEKHLDSGLWREGNKDMETEQRSQEKLEHVVESIEEVNEEKKEGRSRSVEEDYGVKPEDAATHRRSVSAEPLVGERLKERKNSEKRATTLFYEGLSEGCKKGMPDVWDGSRGGDDI